MIDSSDIYSWLMPDGKVMDVTDSHTLFILDHPSLFGKGDEDLSCLYTDRLYSIAFEFGAIRFIVSKESMNLEGERSQIHRHYDRFINAIKNYNVKEIYVSYYPRTPIHDVLTPQEFIMKFAKSNNWYKAAMALDPNAYKTESQPARLREHQDIANVWSPFTGKTMAIPQEQDQSKIDELYSGVHFAFTAEHAALYAIGKATKDDPPVVIEIEPKGLTQQPDVDAIIDQSLQYYLEEKNKDWLNILQSGEDIETIADNLREDIDNDKDNWSEETDSWETADDVIMREQIPIPPSVIFELITNKTPKSVIKIIKQLISGKISPKLLIKMVGQMRVNNSIDLSRVKAIYQVPWVDLNADVTNNPHDMEEEQLEEFLEENGWHMEGENIINENGQIVPRYEELIYDQWLSLTPLYVNKQMYFRGYTSKDSIFHGTTLSRAKSAYPELLGGSQVLANSKVKIENWYKPPFMRAMNYSGTMTEKKDILSKNHNKYTVAQTKAELKPYYIVKIINDRDEIIDFLKDKRVMAYSASQARFKFIEMSIRLQDYLETGIKIEARLDIKGWEERKRLKEQQKIDEERRKIEEEERIKNMWWNND